MGINRGTVLDLINDVHNAGGFSDYNSYSYLFDQVDTMPESKADAEPHWIPVEQDLPKIGEYVLCQTTPHYFKTTNCFNNYHVCQFVDKDRWVDKPHFDWDRDGFPHVVAWTRFEPYKGVNT